MHVLFHVEGERFENRIRGGLKRDRFRTLIFRPLQGAEGADEERAVKRRGPSNFCRGGTVLSRFGCNPDKYILFPFGKSFNTVMRHQ